MIRLEEIIANALAGIPETDVAILAREVVRLRGERAVVVPELTGEILERMASFHDYAAQRINMDATAESVTEWFRKHLRAIPADRVPGEWKTPADHPEWPEPEREGGLTICSDVSVRVLGWIEHWGWHSVVLREDDDTEPSRYFWEDPMDCFTPEELSERLRVWIPMPPEPNALRANQGGADHGNSK